MYFTVTALARCFFHDIISRTHQPHLGSAPDSPPPDALKYLGPGFTDEGFEAQKVSVTCSKYTAKMREGWDLKPNFPNSKALALSTMPCRLLPKAHDGPITLVSESFLLTLAITESLGSI